VLLRTYVLPRAATSGASRLVGVALSIGLVAAGIATATPAGASESMSADLHKLRICESGDNYRENSGNGYYGAYQFSPATWRGLGLHGRPDRARAITQNLAARKLHAEDGWSAWPSCARSEHLR
jgi:resuscitation-promoting factor RpfA